MSSIWSSHLQISLFGESHGNAIGCVIDNIPSGIPLNMDRIKREMSRRSSGSYKFATPRKEGDEFEILSGFFNGYTTGTPLACIIRNTNTRSKDYTPELLRPGHADYTAYKRYKGFQDYRGGGHFSGRITAPLVLAGAICKEILYEQFPEIKIGSRILSIGSNKDKEIIDWKEYLTLDVSNKYLPVIDDSIIKPIEEELAFITESKNSIGGVIEGWVTGMEPGIGNPFFDSIESKLSSLIFSVPAVKGIEFGKGFEFARMTGKEANDLFEIKDDLIKTKTNNNGGINGGISNGMPIIFRCVIKPTASIGIEQETVNYDKKENDKIKIVGRHDPSIVVRAPVVIESVTAICILDLLLSRN